jgi:hypothetical protein
MNNSNVDASTSAANPQSKYETVTLLLLCVCDRCVVFRSALRSQCHYRRRPRLRLYCKSMNCCFDHDFDNKRRVRRTTMSPIRTMKAPANVNSSTLVRRHCSFVVAFVSCVIILVVIYIYIYSDGIAISSGRQFAVIGHRIVRFKDIRQGEKILRFWKMLFHNRLTTAD